MEHPDITAAHRTGYPLRHLDNEDTEEMRDEFITEDLEDFYKWVKKHHSELIEEYIDDNESEYYSWLY